MTRVIVHNHLARDVGLHELAITLWNEAGDTLTKYIQTDLPRSTQLEHELRRKTEAQVNADPQHGKYGPWKTVHSGWQR